MYEYHVPVMINECSEFLITNDEGIYFEGTVGFGGHTEKFLSVLSNNAKLIGTELDNKALSFVKEKFSSDRRLNLYKANFVEIDRISKIEFVESYDGIFIDLGVSSYQLNNKDAGFTYRDESKLDLRIDKTKMVTAADIVNSFSEEDLTKIFFEYGEEKESKKIAGKIIDKRLTKKFSTSLDLSAAIGEIIPVYKLNKVLSRIFQALRIYINDELGVLKNFLSKAVLLLKKHGNIVVLTYHSLEDRIVKEFFKYESLTCVCPPEFPVCVCDKEQRLKTLTKKPVVAGAEEIKNNRRARSAKLRVAKRV
jgi:16S rRNA (cytosine1402-N4)-methyltransferase